MRCYESLCVEEMDGQSLLRTWPRAYGVASLMHDDTEELINCQSPYGTIGC